MVIKEDAYHSTPNITLFNGKMQDALKELEDNSVDSVVTDPPYGISFMSNKWDYDVPTKEMWEEVSRVLKPGGHLLSFSSARTYHRMAVAIEDAGFEIRDQVMWVYGSGFPKSHNLGKSYDKKHGRVRKDLGANPNNRPNPNNKDTATHDYGFVSKSANITKGDGPLEGWGTALKPAHEPICVARKPISEKTILDNVLKWGVGGLNIDKSRVPNNGETFNTDSMLNKKDSSYGVISAREGNGGLVKSPSLKAGGNAEALEKLQEQGRWPANFIHDGSQGVLDLFPDAHSDKSAARFFYVPKVSKKERNEGLDHLPDYDWSGDGACVPERDNRPFHPSKNTHPTVKPIALMEYLIKMVTPAGGVVLDPFMGSGSTGCAAVNNGYDFIGVEMEEHSYEVAKARIEYWGEELF